MFRLFRPTLGIVLLIRALSVAVLSDEPKPPMLTPDEQKLANEATRLDREAAQLYQLGRPTEALARLQQVLELRRTLYPKSKYPDGHPELADSLSGIGSVLKAMGTAEKALPYFEQAMGMYRTLYPESKYPDGHLNLAYGLNHLGGVMLELGSADKALPYMDQALIMMRRLYPESKYPNGHPNVARCLGDYGAALHTAGSTEKALPHLEQTVATYRRLYSESDNPSGQQTLAHSINNLGTALLAAGSVEKAIPHLEQALSMYQRLFPESGYPSGHPQLVDSLSSKGGAFLAAGATEKALPCFEQALVMCRKLYPATQYPNGHPRLANSLINLGGVLLTSGSVERALPCFEEALAMLRKLFPESGFPLGHPLLAYGLSNVGGVLAQIGLAEKALPYMEQALAMRRSLYPESKYPVGHPEIASGLNSLADVLSALSQRERALQCRTEALSMYRILYPEAKYPAGHPDLAATAYNLGLRWWELGSVEKALPYYEEVLAMCRKLYPESSYPTGHPNLVHSLDGMGFILQAAGSPRKALPFLEQSLALQVKLRRQMLLTASEADALDFLNVQPRTRDGLLSVSLLVGDAADSAYQSVWMTKATSTRLLEQRHAAARLAGNVGGSRLDDLKAKRRRIDQLLQNQRMPSAERDRLLRQLCDERDQIERELAATIPLLKRADELDALGPKELKAILPEAAVFIDVVLYMRNTFDAGKPGKAGEKRTRCYAAFVVSKKQEIIRVELGEAAPIDHAIGQWRRAIDGNEASPHGANLVNLVWAPLAEKLPQGTRTLYFALDGDLARLPWHALPVGDQRVLLEDFATAQVPHGTYLLDHLKFPRSFPQSESLLTLGAVEYGASKWPALPGTAAEVQAIAALAAIKHVIVNKTDATPSNLAERLPHARFAHLATHGAFEAEALAAERKRAAEALVSRSFGDDSRRVAAKNPLGFVGLVLANGETMSGLSIMDLPLENLKLVTLSACETGLGEYTGGEGVQGLQRAFHLAGCPNVVASLWKVSDAATAALMTKFYHEMWVNKKPPIEALREAQLTIYRRPDLIPTLAMERGIKLEAALNTTPSAATTRKQNTMPTKLWAAFVLSGVGR